MINLDLSKCEEPIEVVTALKAAAIQYMSEGILSHHDYQAGIEGNPWLIIADELKHAVANIESKLPARWR